MNRFAQAVIRSLKIAPSEIKRAQIREMSWLAVGQAATVLLGLVSIKLTTSIGPTEYGRFVLASTIMSMLTLALFGPLEQGYVRMYFEYRRRPASGRLFARALRSALGLSAVGMGILAPLAVLLLRPAGGEQGLFYAGTAAMTIASVLNVPLNGMLNAMRRRKAVAIIQIVERLLLVAGLVLFVRVGSLNATLVVLCVALSSAIAFIVRLTTYTRVANEESGNAELAPPAIDERQFRRELLARIAVYAAPFGVWGAMSWIHLQGERWVINAMLPAAEVGRYGLAASLVNNSVVLAFNVVTQFATPMILDKFSDSTSASREVGERLLRIYGRVTLILFGAFALAFLPAGRWLVLVFSTHEFSTSMMVLPILTLGLGAFYYGQALSTLGMALHKPRVYIFPKLASAVLSLLVYIAGCAWGGILGVVIGVLVVNVLYTGLVFRTNARLRASSPMSAQGVEA